MWIYEVVIADAVRRQYNLDANTTSDVSALIFEDLRQESSSFQLVASNPQGREHIALNAV